MKSKEKEHNKRAVSGYSCDKMTELVTIYGYMSSIIFPSVGKTTLYLSYSGYGGHNRHHNRRLDDHMRGEAIDKLFIPAAFFCFYRSVCLINGGEEFIHNIN